MKTVMVNQAHSCGAGCGCGRNRQKPATPSITQQVEAELKRPGNERVIASVNEQTGQVTTVIAPQPYYAASANLTSVERKALEQERKKLSQGLRTMTPHERAKAMARINVIEGELRRGRSNEEAERRTRERETERRRERGEPV